jgi:hypothetical protein
VQLHKQLTLVHQGGLVKREVEVAHDAGRDAGVMRGTGVDTGGMCGASVDVRAAHGTGWGAGGMATVSETPATEEG